MPRLLGNKIKILMNDYISNLAISLAIKKWPNLQRNEDEDSVSLAIRKYENHPSIVKIKSNSI